MSDLEDVSAIEEETVYVALSKLPLDLSSVVKRVKSPKAGAIVLFAGTTRDSFEDRPVKQLAYSAYIPLALQTLFKICKTAQEKHGLIAAAVVHRLGEVPIGEESILVVVSAPHRTAGWRAGEEILEECKANAEIWKFEEFSDGGEGAWRANADQQATGE
ncbi:MAG: Molybdopterin synthase catalytic subunit [Vezdaea aestivalis]|nr:MAG: Molybdopterin synthase catalytic subunit [Vezdaea aestivalis]